MTSKQATVGSFIEAAPPGELSDVVSDLKILTADNPSLLNSQETAFQKYNEEQFATVKLPGASQEVLISPHNKLNSGRYFDVESQSEFEYDHVNQKASGVQTYALDSKHADLVKSLLRSFKNHAAEHFPSSSLAVCPTNNDSQIALVLVANKYSPNNFWNGRWRSQYLLDPTTGALTGSMKVDVHYYEDGNVRLLTEKPVIGSTSSSPTTTDVMRQIVVVERKYQEDLNRAFISLSEGAFKSLRRQLPVTRQKVEWEKISGYRLGQDIGGGGGRGR